VTRLAGELSVPVVIGASVRVGPQTIHRCIRCAGVSRSVLLRRYFYAYL